MVRRYVACGIVLVTALMLVCIIPSLSASPEEVSIFQVSDELTLKAGGKASFEWVAYNNGTDQVLIVPSLVGDLPRRVTWTLEPSYAVVEAGEGCSFFLNLSAGTDLYNDRVTFGAAFNITDMSLIVSKVVTEQATLRTVSLYGGIDRENRILGIWENPLPAPLDGEWGAFLVSMLIWLGIGLLVFEVVGPVLHQFTRRTESKWDDVLIDATRIPLSIIIMTYGVISSIEILRLPPGTVTDLELGYSILMTIIVAWLVYRVLMKVVVCYGRERCEERSNDAGDALVNAVSLLGKVLIPLGALFAIAGLLGVDLGNVILGVGFLGLIVGYATKSSLSNIFSGLQLLLDRPFKAGDRVPLDDGHTAQVIRVGLLSTRFLDMETNEQVVIPNSLIESRVIVNMNAPDLRWKSNVKVRVPADRDPLKVEELMMEAARRTPHILQGDRAPVVRISEVKDGRMLMTIFIWIDDVANRHVARTEYRRNLVEVFREAGMEFALPRKQVWLKDG